MFIFIHLTNFIHYMDVQELPPVTIQHFHQIRVKGKQNFKSELGKIHNRNNNQIKITYSL